MAWNHVTISILLHFMMVVSIIRSTPPYLFMPFRLHLRCWWPSLPVLCSFLSEVQSDESASLVAFLLLSTVHVCLPCVLETSLIETPCGNCYSKYAIHVLCPPPLLRTKYQIIPKHLLLVGAPPWHCRGYHNVLNWRWLRCLNGPFWCWRRDLQSIRLHLSTTC